MNPYANEIMHPGGSATFNENGPVIGGGSNPYSLDFGGGSYDDYAQFAAQFQGMTPEQLQQVLGDRLDPTQQTIGANSSLVSGPDDDRIGQAVNPGDQGYRTTWTDANNPDIRYNTRLGNDGTISDVSRRSQSSDNRAARNGALIAGGITAGAGAAALYGGAGAGAGAAGGSGTTAAGGIDAAVASGAGGGGAMGSLPGATAAGSAGAAGAAGGAGSGAGLGSMLSGLGDYGSLIAGGLGGVGSYLDARDRQQANQAVMGRVTGLADQAQERLGQTNAHTNNAAGMISGMAGDNSGIDNAISANQGFMSNGGQNAYAGQNPYLNNMIDQGVGDISRGYQQLGQTADATAARGNAFGGSAWQQVNADNQRAAGTAMGNYVNNARFGDYQMQAGLDEARLGRQQSAIGMAPGLNSARFTGAQNLANVGQQQFNQGQTQWGNLQNATNSMVGSQAAANGQTNPWAAALGGAAAGAGAWNQWRNAGN